VSNPFRFNAIEGLKKGDTFAFTRTFTEEETHRFGDLTRDYNPVHYDTRWTDKKGMKGLICHGLLVGSMVCEFGGQVGWLASGMEFKFIKPVYFDDAITCTLTLKVLENSGRAEAEAQFMNQNNSQIGYAYLKGRIPISDEKLLLQEMVNEGDLTNKLSDENYSD